MEAIVKINFTEVSLTNSVPRRVYEGHTVKQHGSLYRSVDRNSNYHCHVNYQKVSARVGTRSYGGIQRHNTRAELTRIDKSCDRLETGKESLKRTDLAADHESIRRTNYGGTHQSHHDVRVDMRLSQAQRSDAFEEDSKVTGGSSTWARLAGADCPLNPDEELCLSVDVQDMLFLESRKAELEKELGRPPTVDEWAHHCGISIFKLYARVGKGRAAKRKMIAANLPLVSSVAEQFRGRGLSHWELCQEGVQGLARSAEKYDISYNTKFSTYSFMWIWERMSAGVKKFRHVLRISRTVYETASILLQQKEEFKVMHGRPPSLQELADLSHVDMDRIRNVTRLVRPVKSIDEPVSTLEGDYGKQFEDQNPGGVPWTHIMETELRAEVSKALLCLTPREKMVLEMRYGLCGESPQGRAQVGLALDLTYESIRLIEKKALDKLRQLAKEDGLQQYLSGSLWAQ